MATTLQDLRNIFYDILREDENDNWAYPLSLVDLMINSAQQRICNWLIINPLTKETARKWSLEFLNSQQLYKNIASITLTTATTSWDVSIEVSSTTNYPTTWYLYIAWTVLTYTWKTATTFTWVSWVTFDYDSWTEISPAFQLPTDLQSVINITYNNKFKLPWKVFDDIFEDLNKYKWNNYNRNDNTSYLNSPYRIDPFYTIVDWQYLVIFNLNDDWLINLRYEKKAEYMTDSTDTATINDDIYAKTTISYIAVWEMLYNRWEEQRAWEILNFWIWQVKEMYNHYNNKTFEKISWTQYKTAKSTLNI